METTICSNQGFFTFYFLQIKEKAAIAIHANGYKASTAMNNYLSTHFQNQAVKKLRQKKKRYGYRDAFISVGINYPWNCVNANRCTHLNLNWTACFPT